MDKTNGGFLNQTVDGMKRTVEFWINPWMDKTNGGFFNQSLDG
jgi:hypothetical protein